MPSVPRTDGYSALSIVAHWITAILVIALFVTHEGDPGDATYAFHVGAGAIAGLFLLWRVWHRVRRGMTSKPDQNFIFNLASRLVLWGFLASIVVVSLTGYLLPWSLGQPLDIFGLISIPSPLGASRGFGDVIEELHEVAGQAFPFLLALHVAGAAKHAFIDKDSVVKRMFKPTAGGR